MDQDNGRLLARVDERTGAILDGQNRLRQDIDRRLAFVSHRLEAVEVACSELRANQMGCSRAMMSRWDGHDKEHQGLSRKSWAGDIVAGVAATVAGALAILKAG